MSIAAVALLLVTAVHPQVTLPAVFSDHMAYAMVGRHQRMSERAYSTAVSLTAVVIAGDTALFATKRWTPPAPAVPGHLIILSLADGKERQRLQLPQAVVRQGLAVHAGGIVGSCRDGLVVRYEKTLDHDR